MASLANVAAALMEHLCAHDWHGYTQSVGRWGDGEGVCDVTVEGRTYSVAQGDRDCSSAVIDCWRQALKGTPYEGKLDTATYTGNMRQVFTASGLFEWKPMSFIAQRGDVYLVHHEGGGQHTAMCTSSVPDMLAEFNINEFGGIVGGKVGDQTGGESRVANYYDFPWDGILHYNGKADKVEEPKAEELKQERTAALEVWGYKNPDLEKVDAYQIVRDIRDIAKEIRDAVAEVRAMLEDCEDMKADVAELRGVLDLIRK